MAQSSALCFPFNRSATAGTQASQGATAQAYSNSPPLEEIVQWSSFYEALGELPPPPSYSSTLGLTNRNKGIERPPV